MSGRFKPPGQCPVCGEWVPRGAAACDDCGACAKSGWSGNTHEDGLDLPSGYGGDDEEFDYDDFVAREFGGGGRPKRSGISSTWRWVALVLLIILVLGQLISALA